MKLLPILLLLFFSSLSMQAQEQPLIIHMTDQDSLMQVFNKNYSTSLLVAADTNLSKMRQTWEDMLIQLEQLSKQEQVDLRGAKLWFKVYWQPNGEIAHIAYQLQPRSLNLPRAELEALLQYFVQQYRPSLFFKKSFSHQTAISFPTYLQPKK